MVIKKDGRREAYDREKVLTGLLKACEKRPVSRDQLDELVDEIESATFGRFKNEIHSDEIGNQIIERLQSIDQVAYVRFASVYRHFKDINQFMREIKGILGETDKHKDKGKK